VAGFPAIGQTNEFLPLPSARDRFMAGRSHFDSLSESLRKPQGRIYFAGDFTEDTHSNGASQSALRVIKDILQKDDYHALGTVAPDNISYACSRQIADSFCT
jgi:hypothetical protein